MGRRQKLVQFGAGSIGRGFIAQLFHQSGWEVVFIEASPSMAEGLRSRGFYRVVEVDGEGESETRIDEFRVIDASDKPSVIAEASEADLLSTAVGLGNLPSIAAPVAGALAIRRAPLDILICENGATAAEDFREAVLREGEGKTLAPFGCVRTSIGRMAPVHKEGTDPYDVRVEPYRHLPVEAAAFRGPIPDVAGLEPKPDFTLVLRQKLYLHNLSHAVLAYVGIRRGHLTVPQAIADPELREWMRKASGEAIEAMVLAHGSTPERQEEIRLESWGILNDLERRYSNTALSDTLERVARDPIRKLAPDDRLVGAARLCLQQGIQPLWIVKAIEEALLYECGPDDPAREEWSKLGPEGRRAWVETNLTLSSSGADSPVSQDNSPGV